MESIAAFFDGIADFFSSIFMSILVFFNGGKPLVGMEGQVLKVNKGRRLVQIAVGGDGNLFHAIWCSIEYVQERDENEDP